MDGCNLVSTNGKAMLIQRLPDVMVGVTSAEKEFDITIPAELLTGLSKLGKGFISIKVGEAMDESKSRQITIEGKGKAIHGMTLNSSFVNWRSVFPRNCNGAPAFFNPAFVALFAKSSMIISKDKDDGSDKHLPHIQSNGEDPARVYMFDQSLYGILSPVRNYIPMKTDDDAPEWMKLSGQSDSVVVLPNGNSITKKNGGITAYAEVNLDELREATGEFDLRQMVIQKITGNIDLIDATAPATISPSHIKDGNIVFKLKATIAVAPMETPVSLTSNDLYSF